MTPIRAGLTITSTSIAIAAVILLGVGSSASAGRSAPPSDAHAARPARQSAPCPDPAPPGTILWSFQTKGGAGGVPILGIPAVAEDGSVYVTTSAARMYGVDCLGEQRWVLTYRHGTDAPVTSLDGAPTLGQDGVIHVGGNAIDPNLFLALAPDGRVRWVYPHAGGERFFGSSALDRAGRIFVATSGQDSSGSTGSILAFTPSGTFLPGFPVRSAQIKVAPVILNDDRAVFISSLGVRIDFGIPTPTPMPVRSTPTPWAGDLSVVHLPLSLTFTNRTSPTLPAPAPEPTENPRGRPGPSPRETLVPAQWHILSGAPPAVEVSASPGRSPDSAMAAAGSMVVLAMFDSVPHVAAFDVDARPPRLIWEHFLRAQVAGSPLIGRRDPLDGRYELVYLDRADTLVSLKVPGAAAPGDPASPAAPTFNWAVQLSESAQSSGAPALGDADIVYVAAGNAVEAYRREDGELVWSTDIGPDVATGSVTLGPGGVLYVGTETGRLLAIATESKGLDPEAAWPALRHDARNSGRTDR